MKFKRIFAQFGLNKLGQILNFLKLPACPLPLNSPLTYRHNLTWYAIKQFQIQAVLWS